MKIGDFVFHEADEKREKMKLLIVEELRDNMMLCRYIHYQILRTSPERKFHVSELVEAK